MLGKLSIAMILACALACVMGACASSTPEPETAAGEPSAEPAHEAPPAPEEPPSDSPPAEGAGASGGRLAFTSCDPENRPQACTREYRPVCAEVDNGVRCVTTPCDSTDQKEFPNGCTACSEAKTQGYWPVACAELNGPAAP